MTNETKPPLQDLQDLQTLNRIAATLNQAVDVRAALQDILPDIINLMGLETGWIFIKDHHRQNRWAGLGYDLAAHHNLPPGMDLTEHEVWNGGCDCQSLCNKHQLTEAYNEVRCSRLRNARGDTRGLHVHASVPLRSGDVVLGILNVASETWAQFDTRTLNLLTNIGFQIGTALERSRLYDMLRERRIHEQSALLDLSYHLLGRPDLRDLMQYLLSEIQRLLDVEATALLLLGDEPNRLYFKASLGWKYAPEIKERWLPADESSGPGKVMQTQTPHVVEDLQLKDPNPWMSDWLKAEGFRGHAIVPLIAEGRSIGALVVDTRVPRKLNDDELRLLQLLANQAALALEKARLYKEEVARQNLEDELTVSQRIQLSMLPEQCPQIPGWQFTATYQAAKLVGGDFYDFFSVTGEEAQPLGIVIADVADKGVPAALVMALSRTIIRSASMSGRAPARALTRANELMLQDSRSEMFLTAFYAKLDPEIGQFSYTNAGHNPPLWYRADYGECQTLAMRGIVLGILDDIHLQEETIYLARGDILLLYTDGVTEAMNSAREEFGIARLQQLLCDNAIFDAAFIEGAIINAVQDFTANMAQNDDFTMVIIKRVDEPDA
ncbi:MAG: SpoIIE family protein phosphatase [Anaerolineales bacterium]